MSGNLHIPPTEWLAELFEYEYCAECGGDEKHHTAMAFLGNWFARCDYAPNAETGDWHPTICRFHATQQES